ncbi:MAG: GNAT family N-acetyltransferase [Polyangiaceae bacterium]|nr:GNAT family N-acetyltransferase [Polyangiaceae bacterium]
MFTIRRASESDVDPLVPLKTLVHALHVERRPDFFRPMTAAEVAASLREGFADRTTDVWMAEEEGEAIGYVLAARRQRDETSYSVARQWCEIYEVAVEVSQRRRGVARALIERAVAHAREAGIEAVELTTWAFNEPAHAAFASMGFEPMLVHYELGSRS